MLRPSTVLKAQQTPSWDRPTNRRRGPPPPPSSGRRPLPGSSSSGRSVSASASSPALFYETAGGAPGASGSGRRGGGRAGRGRRSARERRAGTSAGTNAAGAGGQAFSGTRALARRKNQRSQARKKSKKKHSGRRQGGGSAIERGGSDGGGGSASAASLRRHQHRLQQNVTPGGTPFMSQSLPVLAAAGSELSDAWKGKAAGLHSGAEPNLAWESQRGSSQQHLDAEDVEMTRFKHLGEAEASLRLPPTPDMRPQLTDAYKTYTKDRTRIADVAGGLEPPPSSLTAGALLLDAGSMSVTADASVMEVGEAMPTDQVGFPRGGGGGQTLGGFNLPMVEQSNVLSPPRFQERRPSPPPPPPPRLAATTAAAASLTSRPLYRIYRCRSTHAATTSFPTTTIDRSGRLLLPRLPNGHCLDAATAPFRKILRVLSVQKPARSTTAHGFVPNARSLRAPPGVSVAATLLIWISEACTRGASGGLARSASPRSRRAPHAPLAGWPTGRRR